MIFTVFPKDSAEVPQDFPTFREAQLYGDEELGKGNYVIEYNDGEFI